MYVGRSFILKIQKSICYFLKVTCSKIEALKQGKLAKTNILGKFFSKKRHFRETRSFFFFPCTGQSDVCGLKKVGNNCFKKNNSSF